MTPSATSPFTEPTYVGNDVVDLGNSRATGRSSDERFVGRVLAHDERRAMERHIDPDLDLWSRWAAKEAAFKVVSKVAGEPPPFVHRSFVVAWSPSVENTSSPPPTSVIRSGVVTHEGMAVPVQVRRVGLALHALAVTTPTSLPYVQATVARLHERGAPWNEALERLQERFTARELDAIHSHPSAAVRLGARAALGEAMGLPQERIEIVCRPGLTGRRPPFVLVDGGPSGADVSLSHDGDWVAWSFWVPEPRVS